MSALRLSPIVLAALVATLSVGCAGARPVLRTTPLGMVEGRELEGIERYRGLPFAEAPIGPRRFAPPTPSTAWTGTRLATVPAPKCAQLDSSERAFDTSSSEDCLYVDVWAPTERGTPLPVMVFFPGGAYVRGSGAEADYDGTHLAATGRVVVVNANYRLGPLGFLSHPSLDDGHGRGRGDAALLDQRAALAWVRDNIAAFGGDPANVTLFGESAGAGSVCMHLVSPASRGLFARAVVQSAPCTTHPLPTRSIAEEQGAALASALGCVGDGLADCLLAATPERVLTALPLRTHLIFGEGHSWGPIVDGETVPMQPVDVFRRGREVEVPLIIGATADEGTVFFLGRPSLDTVDAARTALEDLYTSDVAQQIIDEYQLARDPAHVSVEVLSDAFACAARRIARLHRRHGQPTYLYSFEERLHDGVLGLGAFHGADLPFVFDNTLVGMPVPPDRRALVDAMQGYWSAFAWTADPNGGERLAWPLVDGDDTVMRLRLPLEVGRAPRTDACAFWDRIISDAAPPDAV